MVKLVKKDWEKSISNSEGEWSSVPYGMPLTNQKFRVCDETGKDCEDNIAGELWIGGDGVAEGYYNDPQLTDKSFITDNGERWYKTGDYGCFHKSGIIEFLGRKDNQVKVSGFRIELGEIDSATQSIEGIEKSYSVVKTGNSLHILTALTSKTSVSDKRIAEEKIISENTVNEEHQTEIIEKINLDENEKEMIEHIIFQMEKESKMDRHAALAKMRFTFIDKICKDTVVKPHESKERARSRKIDKILTGKYTALPAFAIIMAMIFWLTFGVIGAGLQNLMDIGIEALSNLCEQAMKAAQVNEVIQSLVINGIFVGVGSVLSFLPIIVVLFFFLSMLEDSGYMARIAFVMDKLLRKLGLSGRSFVPMIIGFGCSVPAIMATRTLPSERDRKMTIMLTPFMSCSAKIPIYALFSAAFFKGNGAIVMTVLYFTGILVAILYALILDKTKFKGEPVPFVMELPNYRMPGAKSVLRLMWDKAKDFITRAFTIIFLASLIIWFLQTFDLHFNIVTDAGNSILAMIGGFIAPIFKPLGFSDWRASTALLTGFTAKESVVSTLKVLLGGGALQMMFTVKSSIVFLVFTLLYTPCVAAISAVKRELGGKWAAMVVFLQCLVAWIVAFVVNIVVNLII